MGLHISEEHEALLRTAANLEPGTDLPKVIVDKYWEADRIARKLGVRITNEMLAIVVMMTTGGAPPEATTFLDTIKEESVQFDQRVIAYFRRKWRWGFFQGVDSRTHDTPKIKVVIDDGNTETRLIAPNKVRLPSTDELKAMGEK